MCSRPTLSPLLLSVREPRQGAERPEAQAYVGILRTIGVCMLISGCGPMFLSDPPVSIIGEKAVLQYLESRRAAASDCVGIAAVG